MAVNSRDSTVTRDQVFAWVKQWENLTQAPGPPPQAMDKFIAAKLKTLNLTDDRVRTHDHDNLKDETSLLDMILDDIASYRAPSS